MTASIGCCSEWIVTVFVKIVNFVKLRRIGYLKSLHSRARQARAQQVLPESRLPSTPKPDSKNFQPYITPLRLVNPPTQRRFLGAVFFSPPSFPSSLPSAWLTCPQVGQAASCL